MNPDIELNAVTLNTIHRTTNSTISNPIYYLEKPLYNVKGFKVKNLTIPLSVYNIDSRNNKLYVLISAVTYVVSLTEQNYTASQLATEIATKMSTATSTTFTVTFGAQTNKYTIANSTAFQLVDGADNCYYEIGVTSSDLNNETTSLTPSSPIDLSGVKALSVVCPSFSTNYTQSNYNIIATAVVTERLGDIASYTDYSNDYISIRENSISSIQLILIDERGRKINANKDWLITIMIMTE